MATHFERQLEELHVQIITMGSLCEKAISLSNRAIRGDKCIQEIFDTDKEIDTKEREIENLCMRILLHQQPVARDLREVSAALKMIQIWKELEIRHRILRIFPSSLRKIMCRFRN